MIQATIHSFTTLRQLAGKFSDVTRLRILKHPFSYYANGNPLVRMTSGEVEGMEGYRIRMHRDRKLVVNVEGLAVAIGNIHQESFETIEGAES